MFPPFRLRVSVVACNALNHWLLSTDTPVAGVSVIDVVLHRHPEVGVSVVNAHVYCKLQPTTDTYNLKRRNIYFLAYLCMSCAKHIDINNWSPAINLTDGSVSFIRRLRYRKSLCLISPLSYRKCSLMSKKVLFCPGKNQFRIDFSAYGRRTLFHSSYLTNLLLASPKIKIVYSARTSRGDTSHENE